MNEPPIAGEIDDPQQRVSFFHTLLATSFDGIAITDTARNIILVNDSFCELFRNETAEILGTEILVWLAQFDIAAPRLWAELERRVHHGEPCEGIEFLLPIQGDEKYLSVNASLWQQPDDDSTGGIVSIWRDITQRKRAVEALRASEWTFHAIFNHTFQFTGLLTLDGTLIEANQSSLDFYGIEKSAVLNKPFWETPWWTHSPEQQERVRSAIARAAQGEFVRFDAWHPSRDGSIHYVDCSIKPVKDLAGNVCLLIPEGRDITDIKRAEEKLKASVRDKEILLREIHHRVKNNMQVISSLLNLQSRYLKDQESLEMFQDTQNRVTSMALVHEQLYQSEDLGSVSLEQHIRSLMSHLIRSYGLTSGNIAYQVHVDDVPMSLDKAIPAGLIINELTSNALKHGFSNGIQGEIRISLTFDHGQFTLIVFNSGRSFPPDLDFRTAATMGMRVVNTLARQLNGTVELDRRGGTTFTITFPESQLTEARSAGSCPR